VEKNALDLAYAGAYESIFFLVNHGKQAYAAAEADLLGPSLA